MNSTEKVYNDVHNYIRRSNLHFLVQETPHSAYITLRKKLVRTTSEDINSILSQENNQIETTNEKLKDAHQKISCLQENVNKMKKEKDKLESINKTQEVKLISLKNDIDMLTKINKSSELEINNS